MSSATSHPTFRIVINTRQRPLAQTPHAKGDDDFDEMLLENGMIQHFEQSQLELSKNWHHLTSVHVVQPPVPTQLQRDIHFLMELHGKTERHHGYVTLRRQPDSFSSSPQAREADEQPDLSSADQSDSDGNNGGDEHYDRNDLATNHILEQLAALNTSITPRQNAG